METTGLADPGPVAQTLFVDEDMQEQFELDGIVTLIDAKHVLLHIDESAECKEQIAFADVIVLNKIDLVSEADLDRLETRIRSMNALARIHRTTNADVPIAAVLDVGGFDLDRALVTKPTFLEPEYPFEDGTAKIHRADGTLAATLPGVAKAWVEHLAWSPDGKRLATSSGKVVRIWTAEGAPHLETGEHASTVTGLAWNRRGSQLATTSYGGVQCARIIV